MQKKHWSFILCLLLSFMTAAAAAEPHDCTCNDTPELCLMRSPDYEICVAAVQTKLAELGLYQGEIDGVFGPLTEEAVKAFQSSHNLAVDGKVGLQTWYALKPALPISSGNHEASAPQGKVSILIDTIKCTLTVYDDDKPFKTYLIAPGTYATPTPTGNWMIIEKDAYVDGPLGTRWMRLSIPWGNYGIHGTNQPWSIGGEASKGCVRMYNEDVEELFEWVKYGTPVKIIGDPLYTPETGRRILKRGDGGVDVIEVQSKLKNLHFYEGEADGVFGYYTEQAVKQFQKNRKLPVTGQVDDATYQALGIIFFE